MLKKTIEKLKQKCYKRFPGDADMVEAFCKENQKIWGEKNVESASGEYIWIGMFMVEKWMTWMQPKFLFSKKLEEKYQLNTLVLDWEYNEQLEKLYRSYGFDFISVKMEMFRNPLGFIYGMLKAVQTFICRGTGKGITMLQYKGRQIGQYIYDNTVRTNAGVYTLESTRNAVCVKKVCTSYWFLNTLEKIAKRYTPKIYLFDDLVYDEGMIVQMMHRKKVRVLKCGVEGIFYEIPWAPQPQYWPDYFEHKIKNVIAEMSEQEKKDTIAQADEILRQRFQGNQGDVREAQRIFKNKLDCSADELKDIMGLDKNKKTVVIFSHCLSENPHKCSTQLYEDCYSWLIETLQYIRDIDNVNWVLKGHPVAARKYGEEGVLESLFEKYKSENIHWFPNEYNSALTTQIADVVLTIYGSAGMEYSCLGIPTVHTGKAFYADFGYTVFPKSIDAYKEQLRNMDKLERLTQEQREMAKLVFICNAKVRAEKFDEYDEQMRELNSNFYNDINEGRNFDASNNLAFKEILEYMKDHDMRETSYYQNGNRV